MGTFLDNIRVASEKSTLSATNTVNSLNTMTEKIDSIWNINETNMQGMRQIANNMTSFAAASEEINSSMVELGSQTAEVSTQCEQLSEKTEQMGGVAEKVKTTIQPFYNLQSELDQSITMVHTLDKYSAFHREERTIYLYTTWAMMKHLSWVKQLGAMIDAGEVSLIELDPKKSTFGRVYPVFEPYAEEVKQREIWAQVAVNHKKSYDLGNKVYTAISRGNMGEARQVYSEIQKLGTQIERDVETVRDMRVKSDFSELAAQLKMMV